MLYLPRLRLPMVLLVLLLLISACALPPLRQIDLSQFRLPTLALQPLTTTEVMALDTFTAQLTAALEQRDYAQLQTLMGDSFVMADWRAEGKTLPSQVALVQLRNHYLLPSSAVGLSPTVVSEEVRNHLLGSDPLAVWNPSVEMVKAIYVTGLSANQQAEALLMVAQPPNGAPYWYSMLVAPDGFEPKLPTGVVVTTHRTTTDQGVQRDQPQFLRFAPGAATAKVSGVLYPGQRDYLVRALAGQRLVVSVASLHGQAELTISSHDKRNKLQQLAKGLREWTATASVTQEYLVTINTDAATPFELITTLDQAQAATTAEPMPMRILFASGTAATTITEQVAAPQRHRYLLRGVAGQTLQVNLTAPENRAGFVIQGITDGRPLKRLENAAPHWTTTLPLTQDYLITVAPTGEAVDYVMELGVQ